MTYTPADAQLPFGPNPFQRRLMPSFCSNSVPRYLFRISAPRSAGITTTSEVTPPAWISCGDENAQDIFGLEPDDAATLLNAHLRWESWHEPDCNLISWTSSLLFALQHGLHRHATDCPKPDLAEVFLYIIDTSEFPVGTFVKDVEIMEAIDLLSQKHREGQTRDLKNLREMRQSKYYFGEYLIQGKLRIGGQCAETSMQRMIDLGVFEMQPNLGDRNSWNYLVKSVLNLRDPFRALQDPPSATRTDVRKGITIAQGCFGERWAVPVATMLLALKPRKRDDTVIVEEFEATFTVEDIENLGPTKVDAGRLPEIDQYNDIITSIHRRILGDISPLVNPFSNLTIGE